MEQNGKKFGVLMAALAVIASVLVMPNVSAGADDLSVTVDGDVFYGAQYGFANLTGSVSSASVDADDDLTISVSFPAGGDDEPQWDPNQAQIGTWADSECTFGENSHGSFNFGTLDAVDGLNFCIALSIQDVSPDLGDTTEMTISVASSASTSPDTTVQIIVSDWSPSTSDNSVKSFTETDDFTNDCVTAVNCNQYTITLTNNRVNQEGDAIALSEPITIAYYSATPGWNIDSQDAAWDPMERKAVIGYIDAGQSYDFILNVSLVGGFAPASSYAQNSILIFQISDANPVNAQMSFEAQVEDNFAVTVQGSGNQMVDNGCTNQDLKVFWNVEVMNFGNRPDNFDITFDTSDAITNSWSVTGASDEIVNDLKPKFEDGLHEIYIEMTVPSGLAADTTHGFTMTVTSQGDSTQTQTQEFSATVEQCYGISMTVDKTTDSADPGDSADFTFTITNDGNGLDTVSLMSMGTFTPTIAESMVNISAGNTGQVVLTMTVPADAASGAKSQGAMLHAYSEGCGEDLENCEFEAHSSVVLSAYQVFDISAGYYYNSSMASASIQQGMAKQLKFNVTNNGNGNDNIGVALSANAPSWVTLSQSTVLVAPGQTGTVTIDIMAPASGTLGAVDAFQIVATSSDGVTTSTTGDFSLTIVEKNTNTDGPTTEEVDDDDGGLPGFGFLSAIAAIGAVLLLRRRL